MLGHMGAGLASGDARHRKALTSVQSSRNHLSTLSSPVSRSTCFIDAIEPGALDGSAGPDRVREPIRESLLCIGDRRLHPLIRSRAVRPLELPRFRAVGHEASSNSGVPWTFMRSRLRLL